MDGMAGEEIPEIVDAVIEGFRRSVFESTARILNSPTPVKSLDGAAVVSCLQNIPVRYREYAHERVLQWKKECIGSVTMDGWVLKNEERRPLEYGEALLRPGEAKQEIQIHDGTVITLTKSKDKETGQPEGISMLMYSNEDPNQADPKSELTRAYLVLASDFFFAHAVAALSEPPNPSGPNASARRVPISADRVTTCLTLALAAFRVNRPTPKRPKGWKQSKLYEMLSSWDERWTWLNEQIWDAWGLAISRLCDHPSHLRQLIDLVIKTTKKHSEAVTVRILRAAGKIRLRVGRREDLIEAISTIQRLQQLFKTELKGRPFCKDAVIGAIDEMLQGIPDQRWSDRDVDYTKWIEVLKDLYNAVHDWSRKKKHWAVACPLLVSILRCNYRDFFINKYTDVLQLLERCLEDGSRKLRVVAIQGATHILEHYLNQEKPHRDVRKQTITKIMKRFFIVHPDNSEVLEESFLSNETGKSLQNAFVRMINAVSMSGFADYAVNSILAPTLAHYAHAAERAEIATAMRIKSAHTKRKDKKLAGFNERAEHNASIHRSSCLLVTLRSLLALSSGTGTGKYFRSIENIRILAQQVDMERPMLKVFRMFGRQVFVKHVRVNCKGEPAVVMGTIQSISTMKRSSSRLLLRSPLRATKRILTENFDQEREIIANLALHVYRYAVLCIPSIFDPLDPTIWTVPEARRVDISDENSTKVSDTPGPSPKSLKRERPLLVTITDSRFHPDPGISLAAAEILKWVSESSIIARGLIANRMIQLCSASTARLHNRAPRYLDFLYGFLTFCLKSPLHESLTSTDIQRWKMFDAGLTLPHDEKKARGTLPYPLLMHNLEALVLISFSHPSISVRDRGFKFLRLTGDIRTYAEELEEKDKIALPFVAATASEIHDTKYLYSIVGEWGLAGLVVGEKESEEKGDQKKDTDTAAATAPSAPVPPVYLLDQINDITTSVLSDAESHDTLKRIKPIDKPGGNIVRLGHYSRQKSAVWMTVLAALWRRLCKDETAISFAVARAWDLITEALVIRGESSGNWALLSIAALIGGHIGVKNPSSWKDRAEEFKLGLLPSVGIPLFRHANAVFPSTVALLEDWVARLYPKTKTGKVDRKHWNKGPTCRRMYPIIQTVLSKLSNDGESCRQSIQILSSPRAVHLRPIAFWLFEISPIPNSFKSRGVFEEEHDNSALGGSGVAPVNVVKRWTSVASIFDRMLSRVDARDLGYTRVLGRELTHPHLQSFVSETMQMLENKKGELRWQNLWLRVHCCRIIRRVSVALRRVNPSHPLDPKCRQKWFRILSKWSGITPLGKTLFNHMRRHKEELVRQMNNPQQHGVSTFDRTLKELAGEATRAIVCLLEGETFCEILGRLATVRRQPEGSRPKEVTTFTKGSAVFAWLNDALQTPGATDAAVDALKALMLGNPTLAGGLFSSQCYVNSDTISCRYFQAIVKVLIDPPTTPDKLGLSDKDTSIADTQSDHLSVATINSPVDIQWNCLVVLIMFHVSDPRYGVRSLALTLLSRLGEIMPSYNLPQIGSGAPHLRAPSTYSSDVNSVASSVATSSEIVANGSGAEPTLVGLNSGVYDGRLELVERVSDHLAFRIGLTTANICKVLVEAESKLLIVNDIEDESMIHDELRLMDSRTRRLLRVLPPWLENLELNSPDSDAKLAISQDLSGVSDGVTVVEVLLRLTQKYQRAHSAETGRLWTAAGANVDNIPHFIRHLLSNPQDVESRHWLETAPRVVYLLAKEHPGETARAVSTILARQFEVSNQTEQRAVEASMIIKMAMIILEPICEIVDLVECLHIESERGRSTLSVVLYSMVLGIIGSYDKNKLVHRASCHALAHVIYHDEVRNISAKSNKKRKNGATRTRKMRASKNVLKLIQNLTMSQGPTRVHSFWYASELHNSVFRSTDSKRRPKRSKNLPSGELLSLVSRIVERARTRKTKIMREDFGKGDKGGQGALGAVMKFASPANLMQCALQMVTSKYQPVGDALTAQAIFSDLAQSQSGREHATHLCNVAMQLYQSSSQELYSPSDNGESTEDCKVVSTEDQSKGDFTRLCIVLECLVALVEQIPTSIEEKEQKLIEAKKREKDDRKRRKREKKMVGAAEVLVNVTLTCSKIVANLLDQVKSMQLPEKEAKNVFSLSLELLLGVCARYEEKDLVIVRQEGNLEAGLWEVCLFALQSEETEEKAVTLLLEIAPWSACWLVQGRNPTANHTPGRESKKDPADREEETHRILIGTIVSTLLLMKSTSSVFIQQLNKFISRAQESVGMWGASAAAGRIGTILHLLKTQIHAKGIREGKVARESANQVYEEPEDYSASLTKRALSFQGIHHPDAKSVSKGETWNEEIIKIASQACKSLYSGSTGRRRRMITPMSPRRSKDSTWMRVKEVWDVLLYYLGHKQLEASSPFNSSNPGEIRTFSLLLLADLIPLFPFHVFKGTIQPKTVQRTRELGLMDDPSCKRAMSCFVDRITAFHRTSKLKESKMKNKASSESKHANKAVDEKLQVPGMASPRKKKFNRRLTTTAECFGRLPTVDDSVKSLLSVDTDIPDACLEDPHKKKLHLGKSKKRNSIDSKHIDSKHIPKPIISIPTNSPKPKPNPKPNPLPINFSVSPPKPSTLPKPLVPSISSLTPEVGSTPPSAPPSEAPPKIMGQPLRKPAAPLPSAPPGPAALKRSISPKKLEKDEKLSSRDPGQQIKIDSWSNVKNGNIPKTSSVRGRYVKGLSTRAASILQAVNHRRQRTLPRRAPPPVPSRRGEPSGASVTKKLPKANEARRQRKSRVKR